MDEIFKELSMCQNLWWDLLRLHFVKRHSIQGSPSVLLIFQASPSVRVSNIQRLASIIGSTLDIWIKCNSLKTPALCVTRVISGQKQTPWEIFPVTVNNYDLPAAAALGLIAGTFSIFPHHCTLQNIAFSIPMNRKLRKCNFLASIEMLDEIFSAILENCWFCCKK